MYRFLAIQQSKNKASTLFFLLSFAYCFIFFFIHFHFLTVNNIQLNIVHCHMNSGDQIIYPSANNAIVMYIILMADSLYQFLCATLHIQYNRILVGNLQLLLLLAHIYARTYSQHLPITSSIFLFVLVF